MLIHHNRPALLLGTAFVCSWVSVTGLAADTAVPPTNVCVNGQCAPATSTTTTTATTTTTTTTQATTASTSSTASGLKWHPGHYVWLDPHTSQAAQLAVVDSLSSETSVAGIQLLVNWSSLEGPTAGDYSKGFAMIDAFLAKLGSLKVPKRLILGVSERSFGTPPAAGTDCADAAAGLLPVYLASSSDGGCAIALPGAAGSLSVTARFWEPAVMDRLIALSQAYAARYDKNPLFEMFMGNGETAVAAPAGSNFTVTGYYAQLERWFDASKKVWTHTQLRLAANYGGSNAQMLSLMTYTAANGGVIIGGPDPELPLPNITRTVQTNEVFRDALGGNQDLRGSIPWIGEVQALGLGQRYSQTPSDLYTYQSGTMHASYMVWMYNTWSGGTPQQWSTGILPFIRSIQGKITFASCPTIYQQGCNTN